MGACYCPEPDRDGVPCGMPLAITDVHHLSSTAGALPHVRASCFGGHHFNCPPEFLVVGGVGGQLSGDTPPVRSEAAAAPDRVRPRGAPPAPPAG